MVVCWNGNLPQGKCTTVVFFVVVVFFQTESSACDKGSLDRVCLCCKANNEDDKKRLFPIVSSVQIEDKYTISVIIHGHPM